MLTDLKLQQNEEQEHQQNLSAIKKMRELAIQREKLDREYNNLLKAVGVTHDQISTYIDNKDNFTQPIWERLQSEKKKLSEKLDLTTNNLKDPKKVKKTYDERGVVQPHWLFVR